MRFILARSNYDNDIDCRYNKWTFCYIRKHNSYNSIFYSTGITHPLLRLVGVYTSTTINYKAECDRENVLFLLLSGVLL